MSLFGKNKDKVETKEAEQTDEQQKLVQIILQKYRKAYNAKANKHDLWEKCYNAYTGDYFKKNLPDYKTQEISNYIFSTVETVIPIMVENNPKMLVFPEREEMQGKADRVQKVLDYEWTRTKFFTKLTSACRYGLIYGTVPIMVIWDGEDSNGLGNVRPVIVSPFNIFPDPQATCVEDAEYIIYAAYRNVGEIIEAYPDKAELLRKATASPQDKYLAFGKDTSSFNADTTILYIEMYMDDYSMEVSMEEEDGQTYKVEKRKYPNGRRIIVAGDVLLSDGANPYNDGKKPIVLWKCYDAPGQFWGISEVENLISPQQAKSEVTNAILESAKLMSNPIWILDKNCGVEQNSLTNRNGLVVRKTPGTEVRRDAPPALPAYIQNIIETFNQDIEHISGVYDVTRGERPTGITAGVAIQSLNDQARGRIKLKVQMLEQMLSELFSMWVRRVQQFWDSKRSVRIMNGSYKVQYDVVDKNDLDGDYDVIVMAGSTMAVNKTARLQQIIQMAQTQAEDGLPLVDRQTVLENADITNLEEVMGRFAQIKEQQMQQQQAQMQQQLQQQAMQQATQQVMQGQQAEADASRAMDDKEISHMMEMEKMGLQQQQQPVESEVGNDNSAQLMQIVQIIAQMPQEELMKMAEQSPELQQLLELLAQGTEQSQ